MAELAEDRAKKVNKHNWVSLVPYGLNQQHPNNYRDILDSVWENRDSLGYALRILSDGCCDGCSLGTSGMHDWTMKGIHLCAVRLQLLRLNTMPAMDAHLFEDASTLRGLSERKLRKMGRLPAPMVRSKGDKGFRVVSWDEAIGRVAAALREVDPKRLAWYMTSRGLTNEAYYAHQKVARFLGTNHVDTSARICHAPSTAGLSATVGCAATTCSYSDWIGADLVVLVGTNLANNQPVATKYLHYAKKAGTKVFVVNPYQEPGLDRYWIPSVTESALFGTKIADDHFQIHAGGDIAFFSGVLKHLIECDWIDRDFIARRTSGWSETEAKVRSLSWETLEASSGLTRQDMRRFAEAFGKARHAIIVWSMGITQHAYGSENVRAIVNLQLAKGNIGREHTGLMPIRGHSGVQGGAEMGGQPSAYVMGFPVNEANAKAFAAPEKWGFEPPSWKGLTAAHMVLAAGRGEIDALWQSGGNFKSTLPEPELVDHALGKIKLRVHQDIVANPTMFVEPADTVVLLPSRTRYEQRGGGTETSTERRIIYSPEIPGPRPGDTRDEWEIPVMVARQMYPAACRADLPLARHPGYPQRNRPRLPHLQGNRQPDEEGRSIPVRRTAPAGGPLPDARRAGPLQRGGAAGRVRAAGPIPGGHAARQAVQQHGDGRQGPAHRRQPRRHPHLRPRRRTPGPEERRRDHPAQPARLVHRTRAHRPHQAGLPAGALAGGQRNHPRRTARPQRRA